MAKPTKPKKAVLFTGVIYSNEKILEKTKEILIKKYGPIWVESDPYDFTQFTKYYELEMGKKLFKKYIVFKKKMNIISLPDVKLYTNKIEDKTSKNNKRLVNLDPGYMNLHKLVLASNKDGNIRYI